MNCKPFLKWVGGKRQLLPELKKRLPKKFNAYHEPFIGGGALFFSLTPRNATLYDNNAELIGLYNVVKNDVEALIGLLHEHKIRHEAGAHDYFYAVRNQDRQADFLQKSAVERAARFVYLNRTCFNGVYRVNSEGFFNVPYGCYKNPLICDETNLRACSAALQNVGLLQGDFEQVLQTAGAGDFVYFDPPYVPLSDTANFTGYTAAGFDKTMQERLKTVCDRLTDRGVFVMLSNSSAPWVVETYKTAGYKVEKIKATRAVNAKASGRAAALNEVIVRNYTIKGLICG
ncbi:MAG: DNA adenine methylase [Campylobacterales bacterium]